MHSPEFKADLVARCQQPGVSVTAIALDHDLHPNMLHRWVTEHARYGKHALHDDEGRGASPQRVDMTPANWIPLNPSPGTIDRQAVTPAPGRIIDEADAEPHVRNTIALELAARDVRLTLHWPAGDHQGLARFARELLA